MCYNLAAVDLPAKPALVSADANPSSAAIRRERLEEGLSATVVEDASRYCPVCSQRLESRRCKLLCPICGYYMSCADYY